MTKTPAERAVEFAENKDRKVAPSLATKAKMVGAGVLLTGAALVGIDRANNSEETPPAPVETSQDIGHATGEIAGDTLVTDTQVDPAAQEQALYEQSEEFANNDGHKVADSVSVTEEPGKPELDQPGPESPGPGVTEPGPGIAQPEVETEIGDAIAVVKGPNGETIHVDPATGQPLPESERPTEHP